MSYYTNLIVHKVTRLITPFICILFLVSCGQSSEDSSSGDPSLTAENLAGSLLEKQRKDDDDDRENRSNDRNEDDERDEDNERDRDENDERDEDNERDRDEDDERGEDNESDRDEDDERDDDEEEEGNTTVPPTINQAPNGTISQPSSNREINVGDSVSFSGIGQDSDNNNPLSYLWDFGGVAPAQSVSNPGQITFNSVGNYTIRFTVTDSLGLSDPTPAIRTIQVNNIASNQAPIAVISTPVNGISINTGDTLFFDSNASDPDNNLPLSYLWNFDGVIPNAVTQTPGNVTFTTPGTYSVQLTVRDSLLLSSAPTMVQINVLENTGGGTNPPVLNTSHAGRYTQYEGSKTCINCHQTEVHEAHASVHYQWQGPAPDVTNISHGGKLGGINDFCGFPDINFIGQITNLDNEVVGAGCATCHAGMGAKPEPVATVAQLNNIDCLVCHSENYKRKVEKQADGTFHFVPAAENMTVSTLEAITDIRKTPTRGSCINCHSYAGGGCNNKRGDLEEAHRNPPSADFDVHMADRSIGGAGLLCTDCHITSEHKIAGRGADLRPTELNIKVACTNCHNSSPHNNASIDKHTAKVDCSVCHIPRFAKIVGTDMVRDFSKPAQIDTEKRLYEPNIVRQSNVTPVYRFNNGTSWIYEFGTAVTYGSNGLVTMAEPLGNRADSKIYPFKRHQARLPFDSESQRILPMKLGILFSTGNVNQAIQQGAADVGWPLNNGISFVDVERYMGISHEVSPKAEALDCDACHGNTNRLDFSALGYDPIQTRNGRPLCSSCHGSESGSFTSIHSRHVDQLNYNCSECHNFNN